MAISHEERFIPGLGRRKIPVGDAARRLDRIHARNDAKDRERKAAEAAQQAVTAVGQAMGAQKAAPPAAMASQAPQQANAYGPPVTPGQEPD